MNALVSTHTVEQICSFRDEAIRHFEIAFGKIEEAAKAVAQADALWEAAAPGKPGQWSDSSEEIRHFRHAVSLPDRDRYLRTARRLIDVTVWTHVIDVAGIEQLMDTQAKNELRSQMKFVPERTGRSGEIINQDELDKMLPPVTPENVYATLERFQGDAEMIFRRGIVNVFTKLDRRFRSHDGFKVGSRVILNNLMSNGYISSYGNKADMLTDVERTFLVLDGKSAKASYGSIVSKISREYPGSYFRPVQWECESTYFKVRIFKNGNAHLWFTDKDLVRKVNKILADHYGEVIGDGQAQEEDPLNSPKTTPARRFGFFPTPDDAAEQVIGSAPLLQRAEDPRLRILEPSAGTGNLARRCRKTFEAASTSWTQPDRYRTEYRWDNQVDCVEIQPQLAAALTDEGVYNRVYCQDFLCLTPATTGLYDRIVMNPPFDRERDIDHVMHAMKFLKDDGFLISIMSAGTEFRETKKASAFRNLMTRLKAQWKDLPDNSFSEAGTNVNTVMLRVWKDGRAQSWWSA